MVRPIPTPLELGERIAEIIRKHAATCRTANIAPLPVVITERHGEALRAYTKEHFVYPHDVCPKTLYGVDIIVRQP